MPISGVTSAALPVTIHSKRRAPAPKCFPSSESPQGNKIYDLHSQKREISLLGACRFRAVYLTCKPARPPCLLASCSRSPCFRAQLPALEVLTLLVANSIKNRMECGQRPTPLNSPPPAPALHPNQAIISSVSVNRPLADRARGAQITIVSPPGDLCKY